MRKILLLIIIILASFLRLYNLDNNRPHLTNDEAALGYNAYSILETGRDEWGEFMPVVFKSFGDWKPGFYVYATVPSVAVFGLTDFAVRLPSALAGTIAVILFFLISRKLFQEERIAYFGAFLLSVNPWHIHFSRGAWEANLALTLLLAAIYFYLVSLKQNKYLLISALFFSLTLWTYQSAKLASVIVLALLVVVFKESFFKINKKQLAIAFAIGLLVSLPVLNSLLTGKGGRIEVKSIFSYERPQEYIEQTITSQSGEGQGDILFTTFHSESLSFARGILSRYFNHYSGRFLFFEGDWANLKHTSPNTGYMLLLDAPLILIGLFVLLKKKDSPSKFILSWLILAPLASAITRDSVHGVRSINMVIPLVIITAHGANAIFKNSKLLALFFMSFYALNFIYYLDAYHIHGKIVDAEHYFYGYKQVVQEIIPVQDNYAKIVFDQSFDQPYIFFLFEGAKTTQETYQPANFQENKYYEDSPFGDVGMIKSLGNVEFRDINWEGDKLESGLLLVGREEQFPIEEIDNNEDYLVKRIYYPDNSVSFVIVKVIRNEENI